MRVESTIPTGSSSTSTSTSVRFEVSALSARPSEREGGGQDSDMLVSGGEEPPTPRARSYLLVNNNLGSDGVANGTPGVELGERLAAPGEAQLPTVNGGGGRRRGATLTSRNFRREDIILPDRRMDGDGSEMDDEEEDSEEEEEEDADMEL